MEDFVSFEIATKLKEKGFREECLSYYTTEYTLYNNVITLTDDKYWHGSDIDYEEFLVSHNSIKHTNGNYVDTPTISQVLKWLREEKKLFIEISCNYTDYFPTVRLLDSRQTDYIRGDVIYSTYEQAALAGIEYSLDNLI